MQNYIVGRKVSNEVMRMTFFPLKFRCQCCLVCSSLDQDPVPLWEEYFLQMQVFWTDGVFIFTNVRVKITEFLSI